MFAGSTNIGSLPKKKEIKLKQGQCIYIEDSTVAAIRDVLPLIQAGIGTLKSMYNYNEIIKC